MLQAAQQVLLAQIEKGEILCPCFVLASCQATCGTYLRGVENLCLLTLEVETEIEADIVEWW